MKNIRRGSNNSSSASPALFGAAWNIKHSSVLSYSKQLRMNNSNVSIALASLVIL